jgi:hypothetical protein
MPQDVMINCVIERSQIKICYVLIALGMCLSNSLSKLSIARLPLLIKEGRSPPGVKVRKNAYFVSSPGFPLQSICYQVYAA